MKRPSFQFYPADWRNNAKLRRCSEAARGAWMDILCCLHDSEEYGVLRWPLADIARSAGVSIRLAKELVDKDVLKGDDKTPAPFVYTPRHANRDGDPVTLVFVENDKPCWYSSRLVRDEWVRLRRGQSTRFGDDNQPQKGPPKAQPKAAPIPPFGDGSGYGPTSSSSSTSTIKKELSTSLSLNNALELRVPPPPIKQPKPERERVLGEDAELSHWQQLMKKVNGLKPAWGKPAHWNASEMHLLYGGSGAQMLEMTEEDWTMLTGYFRAPMIPEQKEFWLPRTRIKFVETFPQVLESADRWSKKNQPKSAETDDIYH